MVLNFYQKLTALFLFFFIGIAVIGMLAFRNNVALTKNTQWVRHTQQILDESEKVFSLMQSIANGERGYAITADSEFLQPYVTGRENIFIQIGILKDLTADNPAQQLRIDSISLYAQKRVDVASAVIDAVNRGDKEAAATIIKAKDGKKYGTLVRQFVTGMQNEEQGLLKMRETKNQQHIETFNRFIWALLITILLILIASYIGFKYYYDRQKRLEGEVKNTNHFLNAILENIPNMIFVKDAQNLKFIRFNRAGEKLLGHNRDEMLGKNDYDFFPKEQADAFVNKDKEVLLNGQLDDIKEEIIKTSQGDKWLHTKKIPITDETGKARYLLGISEDITLSREHLNEIKLLNTELEKTVTQLIEANKEMEAFTYSVSHDLRAPLRIIDGFGEILLKDFGSSFDDEGRHTLQVIMNNAKHMGQLIDDLLNLSRLGRTQLSIKQVNMHEVVEDVVHAMSMMDPQMTKTEIKVLAIKSCECDASLVRQVWINLISNAVKYSRNTAQPVIEIGCKDIKGQSVYYVKDNGVGFDMKYYSKLFGVFQRLHKISEFEGTGVGLALVYRIVTKHNGKIWAEAVENEGATFYFTMPG